MVDFEILFDQSNSDWGYLVYHCKISWVVFSVMIACAGSGLGPGGQPCTALCRGGCQNSVLCAEYSVLSNLAELYSSDEAINSAPPLEILLLPSSFTLQCKALQTGMLCCPG